LSGKQPFQKPALSLAEQVALLQSRGLDIPDTASAEHYLRFIGYYRLVGYARHHRDPKSADPEAYLFGTTFQDVLDLYIFDRKVRLLLFDAIERIEVAIRTQISNIGSMATGPFWLTDANNFDYGKHDRVQSEIADVIGDKTDEHQHQFISHFYKNYSDPYPPSWMLMECFSLGAVSRIYKVLKGNLRVPVAKEFNLQHDILESWLHSITYTRNICAHHSRCWKKVFTIKPKIPKSLRSVSPVESQGKLYMQCVMIHYLMKTIADGSRWSERLRELIASRPRTTLNDMGFPDNWEDDPFWEFKPYGN
jgi:abortive infection bacteriophage resistance protein